MGKKLLSYGLIGLATLLSGCSASVPETLHTAVFSGNQSHHVAAVRNLEGDDTREGRAIKQVSYEEKMDTDRGVGALSKPKLPENLLESAERSYQMKQFFEAEKAYQQFISENEVKGPSHDLALAYHRLGLIAKKRQLYDKAQNYLISAIKNDPAKNPQITFDFAVILYDLGEYERAKNFFVYLTERTPDMTDAQIYLGKTLLVVDPSAEILPLLELEYGRIEAGQILAERCREAGKTADAEILEKMIFTEKVKGDQVFFADNAAASVSPEPYTVSQPAEVYGEMFPTAAASLTSGRSNSDSSYTDSRSELSVPGAGIGEGGDNPMLGTAELAEVVTEAFSGREETALPQSRGGDPTSDGSNVAIPEIAETSVGESSTLSTFDSLGEAPVPDWSRPEASVHEENIVSQGKRSKGVSLGGYPGLVMSDDEGEFVPNRDESYSETSLPDFAEAELEGSEAFAYTGLLESNDEVEVSLGSSDENGGFGDYQIPAVSRSATSSASEISGETEIDIAPVPDSFLRPAERVALNVSDSEIEEGTVTNRVGDEETNHQARRLTSEEKLQQAERAGAKITRLTPEEYKKEIATRAGNLVRQAEEKVTDSETLSKEQKSMLIKRFRGM